jgi:hypothetical protein
VEVSVIRRANHLKIRQAPSEKYSDFQNWRIGLYRLHPVPSKRGVGQRHQRWDGLRWAAAARETDVAKADGQVVLF